MTRGPAGVGWPAPDNPAGNLHRADAGGHTCHDNLTGTTNEVQQKHHYNQRQHRTDESADHNQCASAGTTMSQARGGGFIRSGGFRRDQRVVADGGNVTLQRGSRVDHSEAVLFVPARWTTILRGTYQPVDHVVR